MGFKIEPANLSDAPAVGEIMVSGHSSSPRAKIQFRDCNPKELLEWATKGVEIEIEECTTNPEDAIALKVVDEDSGEIAGYAVWVWNPSIADAIGPRRRTIPLPEGMNTDIHLPSMAALDRLEALRPKGRTYELWQLATFPSFQRRGIGSQLVRYGTEKADRDEVPCFLTSTPMGEPVYRKVGFELVGKEEIGLEEFGGEGVHVHVAMVRSPKHLA